MEGAILGYVVNKVGDLLLKEISLLLKSEQRDLEWVQREMRMMQSSLDYAVTIQNPDSLIKNWIAEVKDLSFQAEDIVDSFSTAVDSPHLLSRYKYSLSQIIARHKFRQEVGELKESIKELTRRRDTYGIQRLPSHDLVTHMDSQLRDRKFRDECFDEDMDVVGLEPHIEAVIQRLRGADDAADREIISTKRCVVSIVGMGGLGKTTLAKKVFKRLTADSSAFDCTAWVVVSQEYNSLRLLQSIAEEVKLSSLETRQRELAAKLREFLLKRKYLIVLDDVWQTQVSDDFYGVFPCQHEGSRVMITTRSLDVGRAANPGMDPYELTLLNEEDAWTLFTRKVFPHEVNPQECCTGELSTLGRQMVKKCCGLPLAIVVVGGLLSTKEKSVDRWSRMAKSINCSYTETAADCMWILALSFKDLPSPLRLCFMYLAIFPEDHLIDVQKLLRLWIAEGFVIEEEGEDLEETAERYLEELIQRCLIQKVDEERIRVHDSIRELAMEVAKAGSFLHILKDCDLEGNSTSTNARRLVIDVDNFCIKDISSMKEIPSSGRLRSLLFCSFNRRDPGQVDFNCGKGFPWLRHSDLKLLRVLDLSALYDCSIASPLSRMEVSHLRPILRYMVNLRYLRINHTRAISPLQHLQTLDVSTGFSGQEIPNFVWQMKTLRHIIGHLLRCPSDVTIGDDVLLPNLRTLYCIKAGSWIKTILPKLRNLKELYITQIRDEWMPEFLSDAIQEMQQLEILRLDGLYTLDMDRIFISSNTHEQLHRLQLFGKLFNSRSCSILPRNLRIVTLSQTRIQSNFLKAIGSLENLEELTLYDAPFEEEQMLFERGYFPKLRRLNLCRLDIKSWVVFPYCLNNLREFAICDCGNLEDLPEELQHVVNLESFVLRSRSLEFLERSCRRFRDQSRFKVFNVIKDTENRFIARIKRIE